MAHDSGWAARHLQCTEISGAVQLANWRAGNNDIKHKIPQFINQIYNMFQYLFGRIIFCDKILKHISVITVLTED